MNNEREFSPGEISLGDQAERNKESIRDFDKEIGRFFNEHLANYDEANKESDNIERCWNAIKLLSEKLILLERSSNKKDIEKASELVKKMYIVLNLLKNYFSKLENSNLEKSAS